MQQLLFTLLSVFLVCINIQAQPFGKGVQWDRHSLIIDGKRVMPVMGEIHYSRLPADEWPYAVRKMREGGVTIIATYVFWNHIEEQEGIFRWDGQRDLRRFLEVCKEEGMPVVLRMGPFCHGEVRNGGIPDWMFQTGCRMRSTDPKFLSYAERLYRQIFSQVQGLQWKDDGPVIACQFDNEYRGSGDYLMALKNIATDIGFDLPFYTRTGWPELSKPVPFGEMLPLYGDYADGFWDKSIEEGVGSYYKAFSFKAYRSSTAIATDQFSYDNPLNPQPSSLNPPQYPYFTCELGGGMATAYHRRPYLYSEDAYSMAIVKLGSGSNLLGYYMYHGGTNPEGVLNTLNECQTSPGTANNDLPVMTYDFQAPLGEFSQTYPQYYMLRKLHLFMQDYGEMLAPLEPVFPAQQDIKRGEDTELRWAYRTVENRDCESITAPAFVFINNYERLVRLSDKHNVRLSVNGVDFPPMTVPSGTMCILPVNIDGIRYATAQIIAKRDGKIYLEQIPGIPTTIATDGKILRNLKPRGTEKPVYKNLYLLTSEQAEHLFLDERTAFSDEKDCFQDAKDVLFNRERAPFALRKITFGRAKVAEAPTDSDFLQSAVYSIQLPDEDFSASRKLLEIDYHGDCARLYADGRLIADNFYYGRKFLFGLWRLPKGTRRLELRILPMQENMPIYFPKEAVTKAGEEVRSIKMRVCQN